MIEIQKYFPSLMIHMGNLNFGTTQKSILHQETIRRIDWKLYREAFSNLSIPQQLWATKQASRLMA
jgi:hypothetical protein